MGLTLAIPTDVFQVGRKNKPLPMHQEQSKPWLHQEQSKPWLNQEQSPGYIRNKDLATSGTK
jgi:hypothetical protein